MSADLSSLSNLLSGTTSLGGLLAGKPMPAPSNGILELSLDLVFEDPANQRTAENVGFSKDSLGELAESIKATGGLVVPISVQPADESGRYRINHGARRYRASVLAGMTTIKAFVDEAFTDYGQVIENLQREALSPMEIALFIGRRLDAGDKVSKIASSLGKSSAFVSRHRSLLSLPDCLAELYQAGFQNLECIYELSLAHRKHPDETEVLVASFADKPEFLTRAVIRSWLEDLESPKQPMAADEPSESVDAIGGSDEGLTSSEGGETGVTADDQGDAILEDASASEKIRKPIVAVQFDGREARLVTSKRAAYGLAWIKMDDDGEERLVDLREVSLVAIIEGA